MEETSKKDLELELAGSKDESAPDWEAKARALWQVIEGIDTELDACKGDAMAFMRATSERVKQRHKHMPERHEATPHPQKAALMTPPKTRAVEIAPGVYVAPEGYTGPVLMLKGFPDDSGCEFHLRGNKPAWSSTAQPAEVAAKLWPVEGTGPGHIEKWFGVELHALREAFRADKSSVNSKLWHAVREYLGES